MTISYKWLCEYLPEKLEPEALSGILTSIGLEVESLEAYEEIRGGLKGLLVGEVLTCEKHPDADKLSCTTVSIGNGEPLQIVCGASNVAAGQKVVLAPAGCTIYPINGEPFTLKKTKIRGQVSEGMICAEDEIGLGHSHDGIMVLDPSLKPGTPLSDLYQLYTDYIFEIGLTPNRMDAMSHLGVARDVCAWLSHHQQKIFLPLSPLGHVPANEGTENPVSVSIRDTEACKRYCGISIAGVTVTDSPAWLQQRLKSIGLRPINNIVDISNYILHETGQPLHAFDADAIRGKQVVVQQLAAGTKFTTLDEKERTLTETDLVICDAEGAMCLAGIFGGKNSGVHAGTKNIFLESAWFHPTVIRRSSLHHGLRTDAATRFEKGVDISQTAAVLMRAAKLILETAGGTIKGGLIDVYPSPLVPAGVSIRYDYLHKLSGKKYTSDDVRGILGALGFGIKAEDPAGLELTVPSYKSDIRIPADIVEEIMRIDGLDQIAIPESIRISPSIEKDKTSAPRLEKIAQYLSGQGFHEIFTNSISNSKLYSEETLRHSVRMINSLSADLDIMRPSMLYGGLQAIAYNLNRKNNDLLFFEFGKTYARLPEGGFAEPQHLCLYACGHTQEMHWKQKPVKADYFFLRGVLEKTLLACGISQVGFETVPSPDLNPALQVMAGNKSIGIIGDVAPDTLKKFDVKDPVIYADLDVEALLAECRPMQRYREVSKFPAVHRDLALVLDRDVSYSQLKKIVLSSGISQLQTVNLFDVFESDKLGANKKSLALSLVFMDEQKTMTDAEIDGFMQRIMKNCTQQLSAEIRK
mgnify:CR=1 FL=1